MELILQNGINLLVIVFGLVEFAKKFGLQGKVLTALSMALGILAGIGYQYAQANEVFGQYFEMAVFGLAVGLAASGIYDFLNGRLLKVEG